MRSEKKSFGEKISGWKVMHTNLRPHLEEMPHLPPLETALQALIEEAEAVDTEFELTRQRRTELARRRKEIVMEADTIRARVGAHVRGSFGYTSDRLIQFGLKPLKTAGERRPASPKPATTTSAS